MPKGIPRWLLTHQVSIEPYEGHNAYGPVYGAPVQVAVFVDAKRARDTDDNDDERVAEATIYAPLDTRAPTGSRVTHQGHVSTVVRVLARDGSGLPTPDHLEIHTK